MSLRVRPAVPCRSHTAREIRRSRVTAFVEPCPSSPCLSGVVSNELLPQQPSLRLPARTTQERARGNSSRAPRTEHASSVSALAQKAEDGDGEASESVEWECRRDGRSAVRAAVVHRRRIAELAAGTHEHPDDLRPTPEWQMPDGGRRHLSTARARGARSDCRRADAGEAAAAAASALVRPLVRQPAGSLRVRPDRELGEPPWRSGERGLTCLTRSKRCWRG